MIGFLGIRKTVNEVCYWLGGGFLFLQLLLILNSPHFPHLAPHFFPHLA